MGNRCGRVVETTRHAPMGHHQAPCAPPPSINTIRQQLDDLLARIETDQQALAAEQAAVARATEALHETPALQAALAQGQELMRGRVLALIDHQLGMLRESPTAVLLRALRQQVREVEA
jgi:hypothetical protein